MAKQSGLIAQDLSKELVRGKQAAFQYKPIVSQDLSWLARTENERNYLESERKRKEQEDLRNQLNKIQQLGLPKEMQGYLNNSVDELVAQVRAGEIDPQSYDFRSKIAGIGGEANQLNNINTNLKTLAAEDKQVILGDEDVSTDYKNKYFAGHNTEFVPGTDIIGKYSNIQAVLQRGTEGLEFDETAANSIVNDWISRNENEIAEISKLKQQGFSGYNLISKLSQIPGVDISELEGYLNTKSDVYLRSEYARDKKAAQSAGIPIESYEDYKADRLRVFIPKQERITEQKIEADPFAKEQFKESLKGGTNLSSVFESPVPYKLPEYPDSSPTKTIATTLNLSKESTLDYQDPETGEMLKGQPTKINRLFYDPQTQQYILGFNRYKKAEGKDIPKDGKDVVIVDFGTDKGKFYLDKSEELYQRANENDLNFDALVSTIMAETKSTKPQVIARLQAIREAAAQSQIPQDEIPKIMRSGDIEVDTSGTILFNGKQTTFEELLKFAYNDKEKAIRVWSQRVPKDKVRRLNESEAAPTNPFD